VRASTQRGTDHQTPPSGPYRGQCLLDLLVLGLTAPVAVVVGLLAALGIRLDSPGPVFFRQERVGLHGRRFTIWKFRTMPHVRDDSLRLPTDDNVTRAGRWLRRFSIDELPQLVNVAVGDMSIVGPRPALPYQVERYSGRQRHRLDVRPGLTGLAQVSGRNALSWDERIELDLEYVATQSLANDLRIIARTARTLLVGEGIEGHRADDPIVSLEGAR